MQSFSSSVVVTGFAVLLALPGCAPDEYGMVTATRVGHVLEPSAERVPFDSEIAQACGKPGVTADGATALPRQPYLQRVTASEASLMWTGPAGSPAATVRWRAAGGQPAADVATWTGGSPATVDDSAPVPDATQYVTTMQPLQPATTYCYRVEAEDGTLLATSGFRTAPAAGTGAKIRLSVVGDAGKVNADSAELIGTMHTVRSDLVLAAGDIAYNDGKLQEYEDNYFRPFADMLGTVPFFPASGNHEYHTADAAAFRQVFSLPTNGGEAGLERWYSFDWGDAHFVVLDTEKLGSAQSDWLEADLTRNQLPWTIVVLHRPPFSSGTHGSSDDVRKTFVPIFERHHVALVLGGHDHDYERMKPQNGVSYVVTGGGGGHGTKSVGASGFTAFSEQVTEFLYIEIDGRQLRLHAIDATGHPFDGTILTAPAPVNNRVASF